MSLKRLIVVLIIALTSVSASAAKKCAGIFTPLKVTTQVKQSVDNTLLALAELRLNLDQAQVNGRSSIEFTALNNNYKNKEKELLDFVELHNIMSPKTFLEKIKQNISDLQKQDKTQAKQKKKEEIIRQRQAKQLNDDKYIDGTLAIFQLVEPGSFRMGNPQHPVSVTLTKPFEMMATLTTEVIWEKVENLYGKLFEGQVDDGSSLIAGTTVPLASTRYTEIQSWIEKLNRLSMLDATLKDIIPDHQRGDIYRLPTEAEWEFVIRGRGKYNAKYPQGNDDSVLTKYAWFDKNAGAQTHPVAELEPLIVDLRRFFDLQGNVGEFMQDWYAPTLIGGKDPQGPPRGDQKVIRGGNFTSLPDPLSSFARAKAGTDENLYDAGFRLVREARK